MTPAEAQEEALELDSSAILTRFGTDREAERIGLSIGSA
jgi:hypothetical protein